MCRIEKDESTDRRGEGARPTTPKELQTKSAYAQARNLSANGKKSRFQGTRFGSKQLILQNIGAPGGIQTPDPRFRRPMLYSLSYGRKRGRSVAASAES